VEGVDFRNDLDGGGGERASDGPGEAGPLTAEDGCLVEDDNSVALFVMRGCTLQATSYTSRRVGAPGIRSWVPVLLVVSLRVCVPGDWGILPATFIPW
jgi:hypothetical protein